MDEGNVGKDLAIKEKIENVVSKIKNGEILEQEELIIAVKGVGIPLTVEKDEKEISYKINILGAHILTLEDEELSFTEGWEEDLKSKTEGIIDAEDLINELKEMELSLARQKEEQQRAENEGEERGESNEIGEEEKPEIEEPEEEKKKTGKDDPEQLKLREEKSKWQEIDLDREFTSSDNLRKWIKDVLHVSPSRLYRRQIGPHEFEYMGEYDGKYKPLELTTDFEGKNTRQQIYIVQDNGEVVMDEVDSLLLTKDGNRGIATKIPDGVSADMTKSFAVTRTKDGKYLATQMIEKTGQNRDPNLPGKDIADRTRSVYDIEDSIETKEEIERNGMKIAQDGVSVDEIGLFEYYKKKGYTPDAIDRMIKDIEENEISPDEAEANEKDRRNNDRRPEGGRGPWDGPGNRRDRY